MNLTQASLSALSDRLPVPGYDRQNMTPGIVHIGVGGFHRSHQARYIHELLNRRETSEWGILGVGLRAGDKRMKEVLSKQDHLYTLITQHPDGKTEAEVIGSLISYCYAPDQAEEAVERMADPQTRIVSLTITEGGYYLDSQTGDLLIDHPDIIHDLGLPEVPRTVYGFLYAALKKRQESGIPAFTILSCDNIQHNGDVARNMTLSFIRNKDPELAVWVQSEVCFPNTMVDRITPVTNDEISVWLHSAFQITDEWPVVCEPFTQWVIEDRFSMGRPALESVGVQFVQDVTPYETMKIRLLNAGHSVLGIPGALHGHPTIDACMEDPVFAGFMRKYMDEEVTPILGEIEGIDLTAYKNSLEQRFANTNIRDTVSRICSESSAKLPKFLIPTIADNLKRGGPIQLGTFVLAAWCYYHDRQTDEQGSPLTIIDIQKEALHLAASRTAEDWTVFPSQQELFRDLMGHSRFQEEYRNALSRIYQEKEIRVVMSQYL